MRSRGRDDMGVAHGRGVEREGEGGDGIRGMGRGGGGGGIDSCGVTSGGGCSEGVIRSAETKKMKRKNAGKCGKM